MLGKRFNLKLEITTGDLLTSASITISILALFLSWSESRALEKREQANEVRYAAAQTIAKLERWQEISTSIFDEIKPHFTEASGRLVEKRLRENHSVKNIEDVRDELDIKINESHLRVQKALQEENIETAYVYLYSYHPPIRECFEDVLKILKKKDEENLNQLLRVVQHKILEQKDSPFYQTADLINALKDATDGVEYSYEAALEKELKPIEKYLMNLVLLKSDSEILKGLGEQGKQGQKKSDNPIKCRN